MHTQTEKHLPNHKKITFNHYMSSHPPHPTPAMLHMFMVAIELYEPGVAQHIQEMCGIYKNKIINPDGDIYNLIKRRIKTNNDLESIIIRKIDANIITRWTLIKSLINNSILETVYVDRPFRKKKRHKNGKRKIPKTNTYVIRRICINSYIYYGHACGPSCYSRKRKSKFNYL